MLCCVRRSIRVVYAGPIMGNMTSSTKLELHIVSQRLQRHRSTIILIHAHEIMRNLDAWFVEYGSRQKYKQTNGHAHRNSPLPYYIEGHWRQRRRGCRGHIPPIFWLVGTSTGISPPILLRTFGYSRPLLVALRSLSLKPISFGYKTPPIRFSQAGGQSSHEARPPNLELALTPLLRAQKICYTHILCYFPLHNIQTLISDHQAVGRK